jgi:hypothetical protein
MHSGVGEAGGVGKLAVVLARQTMEEVGMSLPPIHTLRLLYGGKATATCEVSRIGNVRSIATHRVRESRCVCTCSLMMREPISLKFARAPCGLFHDLFMLVTYTSL